MSSDELLNTWRKRARVAQIGHYRSAVRLENHHRRWGIAAVGLNAAVGTAVFASLSETIDVTWVKILIGIVSIVAAILGGIQTFERAGERAEVHRQAATQFSALQREVELYQAMGENREPSINEFLQDFNARYVQLVKEAPTADETLHREAKQEVKDEEREAMRTTG
jgi:hypothetical protein